jgi:DNA-binding MurR/RpiR family transcriptional regulator
MQRPEAIHNLQHAINQFLPLAIAKAAERDAAAAEMPVFVGVASGATERALPRDFDRKGGPFAVQNPAPGLYDI